MICREIDKKRSHRWREGTSYNIKGVRSHLKIDIEDHSFSGHTYFMKKHPLHSFRFFCGRSSNVNEIDSLISCLSSLHLQRALSFCIVNIPAPSWRPSDEMNLYLSKHS